LTAARDLDEEIAYLRSQRLARVATVSNDGRPDVVVVQRTVHEAAAEQG
jgi:hypothetical protein